ncbi:MAG TPA: glycosyltransferase [Chitinophagaceae bacterium]|nr:glycosyltransferase [Chitinophagaceae bacterium]
MTGMNNKPTIVHVIDDLNRGGAETLLVDLLKELSNHYNVVLVTLKKELEFDPSEVKCQYRYVLGYNYNIKLPLAAYRLRKIIRKHKPVLVRSQLYWSTIIARLGCPRNIPFVFSYHTIQSHEAFRRSPKGRLLKWIEERTYSKRQAMIGVTQEVVDDYDKVIKLRGRYYVLNNYASDAYFDNSKQYSFPADGTLKLVAVGNLKPAKNYRVLLNAFKLLNNRGISCDIFGSGVDWNMLQEDITKHNLPVRLMGKSPTVYEELKKYDAFIMCSLYEGFGISAAEAMAVGLPMFLSDLKVLRKISYDNAVFFDPHNEKDLAGKIERFSKGGYNAAAMSVKGKEISKAQYSKKVYVQKLLKIYDEILQSR